MTEPTTVPAEVVTETDDQPAEAVALGKLESITFPIKLISAALLCASKEETRVYLNGVFLHWADDRIRAVATDGARMFIGTAKPEDGFEVPAWLEEGVIVHSENLAAKLSLIAKLGNADHVRIVYGTGHPKLLLSDNLGEASIHCDRVDGTFPDYQRLVGGITGGVSKDEDLRVSDFEPIAFNSQYLKGVGDVAKVCGGKDATVNLYAHCASSASLATFPDCPGTMLVLMPVRIKEHIAPETARLISPAVKASVAALRAHMTRNRKAAKEATDPGEKAAFEAKAEEFKARIDALRARTEEKALPAPEPSPEATEGEAEATPVIDGEPISDPNAEPAEDAQPVTGDQGGTEAAPEATADDKAEASPAPAEPKATAQPKPKTNGKTKPTGKAKAKKAAPKRTTRRTRNRQADQDDQRAAA